jgi:hypothetical protein
MTRRSVAAETLPRSFNTRSTVDRPTPARRATSSSPNRGFERSTHPLYQNDGKPPTSLINPGADCGISAAREQTA